MTSKSVGIIGGGAWGTGLAQAIARGGHSVQIWAIEEEVCNSINNLFSCSLLMELQTSSSIAQI